MLWARWPNANLGVPTGRASGLVVVDLDGQAGRRSWQRLLDQHEAPQTPTVTTPHGWHVWYRLPSNLAVPRVIRLRDGLDLLGDRGYAIVPPSRIPCSISPARHEPGPCTGGYTWTRRGPIAVLPEWVGHLAHERDHDDNSMEHVSQAVTTPQRAQEAMRAGRKSYGQTAIDGEAARVAAAHPGTRNHTLNAAAWRLGRLAGGGELDAEQAADALWDAARACGLIDDDGANQVKRTIRSGLQAGTKQPRERGVRDRQGPQRTVTRRESVGEPHTRGIAL